MPKQEVQWLQDPATGNSVIKIVGTTTTAELPLAKALTRDEYLKLLTALKECFHG